MTSHWPRQRHRVFAAAYLHRKFRQLQARFARLEGENIYQQRLLPLRQLTKSPIVKGEHVTDMGLGRRLQTPHFSNPQRVRQLHCKVYLGLAGGVNVDDFDMSTYVRPRLDDIVNRPPETCWAARAYEPQISSPKSAEAEIRRLTGDHTSRGAVVRNDQG